MIRCIINERILHPMQNYKSPHSIVGKRGLLRYNRKKICMTMRAFCCFLREKFLISEIWFHFWNNEKRY